jgi:hypothetical protein
MPAPGGAGPGFPLVSVYAAGNGGMKQDTAPIPCALQLFYAAAKRRHKTGYRFNPLRGSTASPRFAVYLADFASQSPGTFNSRLVLPCGFDPVSWTNFLVFFRKQLILKPISGIFIYEALSPDRGGASKNRPSGRGKSQGAHSITVDLSEMKPRNSW